MTASKRGLVGRVQAPTQRAQATVSDMVVLLESRESDLDAREEDQTSESLFFSHESPCSPESYIVYFLIFVAAQFSFLIS